MKEFELKEEHIKLLSKAYIDLSNCETGAPEIDPKRPYGNSYVAGDVAEILGWEIEEDGLTDDQFEDAMMLHYGTVQALQIILQCKTFKPGIYVNKEKYGAKWELKPDLIDI